MYTFMFTCDEDKGCTVCMGVTSAQPLNPYEPLLQAGSSVTVKWRGKPVFVRHRNDEEIAKAVKVPMSALKDPQVCTPIGK